LVLSKSTDLRPAATESYVQFCTITESVTGKRSQKKSPSPLL